MRHTYFFRHTILIISFFVVSISGQQGPGPDEMSGIKTNLAAGEITRIGENGKYIEIRTGAGNIVADLTDATKLKRIVGVKFDPQTAIDSDLSAVGVGDKVVVIGKVSADKKRISAKNIYLLTSGDLAKRAADFRESWRERGISGKVVSIDVPNRQLVVRTIEKSGEKTLSVTTHPATAFKRYAPNSASYSKAVKAAFGDVLVGDQVRVLGDISADGSGFKAEEIVSGTFRTIVGTVTAIDIEKFAITVRDVQFDQPIIIAVNPNSQIRIFPVELANNITSAPTVRIPDGKAGDISKGKQHDGPGNSKASERKGENHGDGDRPPENSSVRSDGNINDLFSELPGASFSDIKVGGQIGVATAEGPSKATFTALRLILGVEPFIRQQQAAAGPRNRNSGTSPSINIPGLDGGIDMP